MLSHCGEARAREHALQGGDDYELCFALPPGQLEALRASLADWTVIGELGEVPGVWIRDGDSVTQVSQLGYDHFGP